MVEPTPFEKYAPVKLDSISPGVKIKKCLKPPSQQWHPVKSKYTSLANLTSRYGQVYKYHYDEYLPVVS